MYFSVVVSNELLYQEARWYFLQQWRSDLLTRETSSLVGAYLVNQYMLKVWKTWFSFTEWVYSYEELFFSISHSEDLIAVAIDTKKIAVDLEYIRNRDDSLLQNIHIPDSSYSERENFYIQRCSKECLVKFLSLTSEEMQEMTISNFLWNQHFVVNEWSFDSLVIIHYKRKEYPVHTNIKDGKVLALLQEDNNPYTVY